MFKIISDKDNNNCEFTFSKSSQARGNMHKLYQKQVTYNLRKYFFTNRVVAIWNCLPDHVACPVSLTMFNNRLRIFLHAQEVF